MASLRIKQVAGQLLYYFPFFVRGRISLGLVPAASGVCCVGIINAIGFCRLQKPIACHPVMAITSSYRCTRQKLSILRDPLRDVLPIRDGRSLWPFSRGNHACSFSFC